MKTTTLTLLLICLTVAMNAQNVGIGVTNPKDKLHIKDGNLRFEATDQFIDLHTYFPSYTGLRYFADKIERGGMYYSSSDSTVNLSRADSVAGLLYNLGSGQLLLGRDYEISAAETFGITKQTAGWGGMYNTVGIGTGYGRPFYGYAIDSVGRAYHYYDGLSNSWRLSTNGADRLFVGGFSGDVGIGTTSPGQRLHVAGNLRIDNTIGFIQFWEGANQNGFISHDGSTFRISNQQASYLDFRTSNISRMAITGAGDVGIGTNSPDQRLHVMGNLLLDNAPVFLQFRDGANQNGFISHDGSTFRISNLQTGFLDFRTSNTSRMVITGAGNVGIGTSQPANELHVKGDIRLDDSDAFLGFYDGLNQNGFLYHTGTSMRLANRLVQDLEFQTANATRMTVKADGKVGIGLDAPQTKLHVKGDLRLDDPNAFLGFYNGATQYGHLYHTGTTLRLANMLSQDLHLLTASTIRMAIKADGKIGIGTDAPSTDLHLVGDMRLDDANPIIQFYNGTAYKGYLYHTGTTMRLINQEASDLQLGTNNVNRLIIKGAGNVGIGTESPADLLHVAGDVRIQQSNPTLKLFSGTQYKGFLDHVGNDLTLSNVLSGKLQFRTFNQTRMTISPSGEVGIGVVSPAEELHVAGDIRIDDAGVPQLGFYKGATFAAFLQSSGDDFAISNKSSGELKLVTDDITRLSIDNAGNVMIGTVTPATGYRLSVRGKIISEELKVQLNTEWPDYVFKPEYDLMPLSELEEYIDENGHLPGVPSAGQVEAEEGIEVGEMNRILLEKIEELSLHVIRLQQEIDELKSNK